jgi:hypothetical protein
VSFSLRSFHQGPARRTRDLYSDKTKTHQRLWCHASVCPVGSFIQIEILAKVRPDLTSARPTVGEGPSEMTNLESHRLGYMPTDCGSW